MCVCVCRVCERYDKCDKILLARMKNLQIACDKNKKSIINARKCQRESVQVYVTLIEKVKMRDRERVCVWSV